VWDNPSQAPGQLSDLELRLTGLETQLNTALGILALMRPAATVLSGCGADKGQQQEFFDLVDQYTKRVDSGCSVSFAEFEDRVLEIVPSKRGDRRFFEVLIEALKLERPSSKPMLDYLAHVMSIFRA
jgi:hypothetical protein